MRQRLGACGKKHTLLCAPASLFSWHGTERPSRTQALERRQRIILDMALDDELLPEQRWPHKSARGRVRPTPPPPFEKPDFKVCVGG